MSHRSSTPARVFRDKLINEDGEIEDPIVSLTHGEGNVLRKSQDGMYPLANVANTNPSHGGYTAQLVADCA
jgi:hypothetical protein